MMKAKRDQKQKKLVTVKSKIQEGCSKNPSFFFYIKKLASLQTS